MRRLKLVMFACCCLCVKRILRVLLSGQGVVTVSQRCLTALTAVKRQPSLLWSLAASALGQLRGDQAQDPEQPHLMRVAEVIMIHMLQKCSWSAPVFVLQISCHTP